MAGKTGTAQSHSYAAGGEKTKDQAWALRDHAWFIAFAPADAPRYAMSVLVEHGGFGADAAAPKAVQIMRVALLKDPEIRARIVQPPPDATPAPEAASSETPVQTAPPHTAPAA
jgi:penicillin-binding protein 2